MILGAIQAPGSVYIINPNGVVFGPTAQVNVHSLIASSLDIGAPTMSIVVARQVPLSLALPVLLSLTSRFCFRLRQCAASDKDAGVTPRPLSVARADHPAHGIA